MTQRTQQSKQYHDLHVPLASTSTYPPPSSSSSASKKRKQQAHMYQMRLHQLGHHGLAFTHTTYGRLNMERDDADVALPWKDLIPPSMMPASSRNSSTSSVNVEDDNPTSFGRTNSLGMKIYRRLNIIVEEVSDVSRILLPSAGSSSNKSAAAASSASSSSISNLFQKYDIISLQPMNEPALQNICELLSPAVTVGSTFVNSNKSDNNLTTMPQIDILVMEYATGSRGGYGLPYKMRKEYLTKALEAGITFELWYVG